jgi:hypothetical protein
LYKNIRKFESSSITTDKAIRTNHMNFVMDNEEVQAVATGVTEKTPVSRKGRVRKTGGAPRAALAVKKKKEPKPPRNPFRRSDTGKLQLKHLQMSKRVETMTPRVDVLRTRLEVMQKRLDFVSGKLTLVTEELETRSTDKLDTVVPKVGAECANEGVSDADSMENVELDDEVEE